ncbi:MAG: hypothetical protein RLZ35_362 [Pseudomonadota bacterium]|jgi:DNA mismatch repair protein MutL
MPIQLLPPQLASQIAAGEVIERPASVLKELLENSIDAGSKQIDVRILKSGIQQIYVQDDGKGIDVTDFPLVFCPHATSKITSIADLEQLHSYGFRGEALASIASVAKVTLTARTANTNTGHRLLADLTSNSHSLIPVPCSVGTTLDVQDLFYNTPARRKFLKSDKTEWLHLEQTFKHAALSCPAIAFSLFHQGKLIYRLPACTDKTMHLARIKQFSGHYFVDQAIELASTNDDLRLWGWVAPPNPMQKIGPLHYFFINGRAIKDKVVTHALQQAFMSVFPQCTHQTMAYVLYFALDPEMIDINVHPAKQEVRFREPRRIHAFLSHTVESALQQGFSPAMHVIETNNTPVNRDKIPLPTTNMDEASLPISSFRLPEKKTSFFEQKNALGARLSTRKQVSNTPIHLGEPLCVIRQQVLLSDNGTEFFLIDIQKALHLLGDTRSRISFFSLQEGRLLIQQLEAYAKKGLPDLQAVFQRHTFPVTESFYP